MDLTKMEKFKNYVAGHKKLCIIGAAVLVAIIALVIVLCNVNGKKKTTTTVSEIETTDTPSEEATTKEKTTEKDTETEVETEKGDEKYRNPLTGLEVAEDITNNRPVSIMVNSIKQAMPHVGTSKADVIIEMKEEGGITRIMALYQDITGVGDIGTVRSTREYYYSWIKAFDGIMVHAGGDSWVLDKIKGEGYPTVDWLTNSGMAFWRDEDRKAKAGSEHSLFTSSERLQIMINALGFSKTHTTDNYTKFKFAEDGTPKDGATANYANAIFSGYKNTSFQYDENTGKYNVLFWNEPYIDAGNNTQVAVTNVIILPVSNWEAPDAWGKVRQKYDMSGGKGYYLNGGKYVEINWTKGDYNSDATYGNPLTMTNLDGTPLEIGTGKTYICVVPNGFEVTIQ